MLKHLSKWRHANCIGKYLKENYLSETNYFVIIKNLKKPTYLLLGIAGANYLLLKNNKY